MSRSFRPGTGESHHSRLDSPERKELRPARAQKRASENPLYLGADFRLSINAARITSTLYNRTAIAYYSVTMKMRDPEGERRRLAELYASMMEEELRDIARDPKSLTETSIEALNSEFARRGLDTRLEIPQPEHAESHPEIPNLVILRHFRDLPEAHLMKGGLESAGIECFFDDDNIVRMDWFISNAVGGIKLLVRPDDFAAANEILEHGIPEAFDIPGVGEYDQPRCPKCKSLDVISDPGKNVAEGYSAESGEGNAPAQTGWKCQSCGHAWPECESPDRVSNP